MRLIALALLAIAACSATEPPAWTPANAAGCQGFWVADDYSGTGNWASRCNSSTLTPHNGPTLTANAMGTHSMVSFDGSSSYFTSNLATSLVPSVVIGIVRVESPGSSFQFRAIVSGNSGSGSAAYEFEPQGSTGLTAIWVKATGGEGGLQVTGVTTPLSNRFWVYSGTIDSVVSAGNTVSSVGVNLTTLTSNTISGAPTVPTSSLTMGAGYAGGSVSEYCACSVVALWVGGGTVSATPIAAIQKWMVTNFFGPDSTYTFEGFNSTSTNYLFRMNARTTDGTFTAQNWSDGTSLRDPDIRYVPSSGKWWRVGGGNNGSATAFDLEWSYDQKIWNASQGVACGNSAGSCWAPGLFVDSTGTLHSIPGVDATGATGAHVLWETHPTTSDPGGAWSTPTALSGAWPTDVIDAYLWQVGGYLHMLFKNEVPVQGVGESGYLEHAWCQIATNGLAGCFSGATTWTIQSVSTGLPNHDGYGPGSGIEGYFTIPQMQSGLQRLFIDGTPGYGNGYWWSDCQWSGLNLINCTTPVALSSPSPLYGNTGYWQHGIGYPTPSLPGVAMQ